MKKNFRRFSAVMIAVIMVLAMGVSAFAATPSDSDTNTITVQNVEAGAAVKAYKIAQANYTDKGFTGYTAVSGVAIADLAGPTADEIGKITNDIATGALTIAPVTLSASGADYVATVPMGLYLVMVEHTNSTIYNPMIVSPNYTKSGSDNTSAGGSVDAAAADNAWAKKDEVDIEKTQADAKAGDDVAVGDDVSFKIETTIPSYAPAGAYKTPVFEITDTLSQGLTLNQNTVAVETGNGVAIDAADYEITKTASGFTVAFDSEYIVANGNADVVITYTAKLNDAAGINFDGNTNTASLNYTNSPTDNQGAGTQSDKTYTYTFGLNTAVNAEESEDVSNEFVKIAVGKDDEGNAATAPLDGAEFALYDADADWKKVDETAEATATSANGGKLVFEGLDAGKYILQETDAPQGYSLNDTEYHVEITAQYNTDGTLKTYEVTIDGEGLTEAATFTYTKDGDGNLTISNTDAVEIPNTTLADLPSTGGIGTYIFTIVGVLIMGAAAGMLIMKRKHRA